MYRVLSFLLIVFCFRASASVNPQYTETLEISAGHSHVCALTAIGVKCFGNAESVTTNAPKNLKMPKFLRAGNRFSCTIVDEGIRCWGEIPNNSKTDILISNATLPRPKLLSIGYEHACAVSYNDKIKCWGRNDHGESLPPQGLKNISELSLGMNNSCAISNGKVICWGIFSTGSRDVPLDLVNPRNLTSGWWHHCVQTDNGIKCWGSPYQNYTSPDDSNIKEFASGGAFNCALVAEGVKCWDERGKTALVEGSAGALKLSIGSTVGCAVTEAAGVICWRLSNKGIYKRMLSFVPSGSITKIEHISASHASTCAYGDEGKLKCWGGNFDNALDVPANFPGPLTQLSLGSHRTCAIKDLQLSCWGDSNSDYATPSKLGNVSFVSSGGNHICAGNEQSLKCWGDNIRGALDIPKELKNFSSVSAGMLHSCAVADDQVTCWGGTGLIKNVNPLKKLMRPKAICAGGTFSCGILSNGKVQCWGEKIPLSDKGLDSDTANKVLEVPEEIVDATEISCGQSHGCAIYNGKIKCWGGPEFMPSRLAPPVVKNPRMLSAGWYHTCAVGDKGLICWGTMIGMNMPNYSLEK
ncbi:MAG: hypothetical protein WC635_10400 [Bacteriovorax sp.]|jgi:hypothetical protein